MLRSPSVLLRRALRTPAYPSRAPFSSKITGDVIGIDLGTTNSCVAVLEVRRRDGCLAIMAAAAAGVLRESDRRRRGGCSHCTAMPLLRRDLCRVAACTAHCRLGCSQFALCSPPA
jgi:hypothetical protein